MQPITIQEVNAFLPQNKWQIETQSSLTNETTLIETAVNKVLGSLSAYYPVSNWRQNEAPKLVREIIAMHLAAWLYARQFGEETANVNSYASWLLRQAEQMLASIASGALELEEAEYPPTGMDEGAIVSGPPIFTTGRVF